MHVAEERGERRATVARKLPAREGRRLAETVQTLAADRDRLARFEREARLQAKAAARRAKEQRRQAKGSRSGKTSA